MTVEPPQTALAVFDRAVRLHPSHPALIYFDFVMSYAQVAEAANAITMWLQAGGVAAADRVAILLQNTPQFMISVIAIWRAGAIPVPINPMYRANEIAKIVVDAEPSAIICDAGQRDAVDQALCEACRVGLPTLGTSNLSFQSRDDPRLLSAAGSARSDEFLGILHTHRGSVPNSASLAASDTGLLLYTSGTTGVPKGVMISHENLISNARSICDWGHIDHSSRILAIAPYFHVTGFVFYIVGAPCASATQIIHYRFEPSLVLDIIRETRPTYTVGAITAFNALAQLPDIHPRDMASFDRIYSGGAPIPDALRLRLRERFGVDIRPCYGMTETTGPTHYAPFGNRVPVDAISGIVSIGIPQSGTDATIIDDHGIALPTGEKGEMILRGPQVMTGYWRKPAETEAALENHWLHTGDIGFVDEQGWFYVVDRKKDMIIASGFKVWPREVEDVLYAHPSVREAAVIGVPDGYRGETVKAIVSLVEGGEANEAALIAHCRASLTGYKVPRAIEFIDDLPKTQTGKIKKSELRNTSLRQETSHEERI